MTRRNKRVLFFGVLVLAFVVGGAIAHHQRAVEQAKQQADDDAVDIKMGEDMMKGNRP